MKPINTIAIFHRKGEGEKSAAVFFFLAAVYVFILALAGCATAPGTKQAQPLSMRSHAKEQTGNSISSILIEEAGGSSTIKIAATEPFKYISYMLDKHRRLVLEIEGAGNAFSAKLIPGNDGLIDHIAIDDSKPGAVKVESVLKRPCGYDLKMEGAVLSVAFTPKAGAAPAPAGSKQMEKKEQDEAEVGRLKAETAFLKSRISDLEDKLRQWKEKSAAASNGSPPPSVAGHTDGILESIESWRLAWQDKDVKRYGDFYAESFAQDGQDKKAWLLSKKEKFEKAEEISVKIEGIQVDIRENQALAKFIQDYQSGRHRDRGIKTLSMIKTSEGWKILSEKWDALK